MRKLLIIAAAIFVTTGVSRASPSNCMTGTLSGFVSLGSSGCSINGNVVSNFSSSLSSTLQNGVTLTPNTSGTDMGGFTADFDLSALAGSSSTLNFTLMAPAGFNVTDLDVRLSGGTGATVTLSSATVSGLNLTLTNSPSSTQSATFSGVSSLNLSLSLTAAANASGHVKLTITPSLSSTGTGSTPEPATVSLFGLGLMGLGLVYRRRMRAINS
jgi:PEP-CTERM motif-containing protein